MTEIEKWNSAVSIAIDNLEHPDAMTRHGARQLDVTVEFFEVRQQLIEFAHGLRQFIE